MGGIKTTGDLVARMQLKKMRLNDAKRYVADKLHCSLLDLTDIPATRTLREELDIGVVTAVPGIAKGLEAKARIAELLGVEINCVERLKGKMTLPPRAASVGAHLYSPPFSPAVAAATARRDLARPCASVPLAPQPCRRSAAAPLARGGRALTTTRRARRAPRET